MRVPTKLMELFKKAPSTKASVYGAVSDNMSSAEAPKTVDSDESNSRMEDEDDPYRKLYPLRMLHRTKDYAWEEVPYKKVILTNPQELIGRVNCVNLMSLWCGTGHGEWEAMLALIFIQSIEKAEANDLEEVDISSLFNHNLKASNNRNLPAEDVRQHLSKSFQVVEETPDLIRVRFIV